MKGGESSWGEGRDELRQRLDFGKGFALCDPLGAEGDFDRKIALGQSPAHTFGGSRIDRRAKHDRLSVPHMRNQTVDHTIEQVEGGVKMLVQIGRASCRER